MTEHDIPAPSRADEFRAEMEEQFDFDRQPEKRILLDELCKVLTLLEKVELEASTRPMRSKGSQGQPVIAPELAFMTTLRNQIASLTKALDVAPPPAEEDEERIGPMSRSESGRVAAAARWAKKYG